MQILPIVVIVASLAAGVGGGYVLKPGAKTCAPEDLDCQELHAAAVADAEAKSHATSASAFAVLQRQFVIPIVRQSKVQALVVTSLTVEVDDGSTEQIFSKEPKLRDAFLQVLFVHAHSGGFDGDFTAAESIRDLKARLNEAASPIVGSSLRDVLVTEIVRQDL